MRHLQDRAGLRTLCRTALLCALLCILSVLSFPIGAVPVTGAMLGVFLAGLLLAPRDALTAVLCYLLLGALGLPVFSSMQGGIGVLFSVTGGFLWGYPLTAWSIAVVMRYVQLHHRGKRMALFLIPGGIMGLCVSYLTGTLWYAFVTDVHPLTALRICVLPFQPLDIGKLLLAISIVTHPKRRKMYTEPPKM